MTQLVSARQILKVFIVQLTDRSDPCWYTSSIECLKAIYNIPTLTTAQPNNTIGIWGDIGQVYSQEDLNLWYTWRAPQIPQGTTPFYNALNGGPLPSDPAGAGIEAELDVQVAYGIVWPQQVTFWSSGYGNNSDNTLYGVWEEAIDGDYCKANPGIGPNDECGTRTPTNIMSSSYGYTESEIPASFSKVGSINCPV